MIVNDYSACDVQIPKMQFYKGKNFRTFGPVGPYLCVLAPGDFARLPDLQWTLTVNGEPRQRDSVANLVYGPAETLSELSAVQDSPGRRSPLDRDARGLRFERSLGRQAAHRRDFAGAAEMAMFMNIQSTLGQYLKLSDVVESHIATSDGSIDLGVQHNRIVSEAN